MRVLATDKSEMISQVLFGETYKVLDLKGKWLLIQLHSDGYEGWIDSQQHHALSEETWLIFRDEPELVLTSMIENIPTATSSSLMLSFGSIFKETLLKQYPDLIKNFPLKEFELIPSHFDADKMTSAAKKWEGTSYLWGGKTVLGVDCSGFVQLCAKTAGYQLFRDASQQAGQGKIVDFLEQAEPGNLAFFDNDEGQIIHVGIIISSGNIIHASGSVRIDTLDHYGIYNKELNKYTHKLRLIKTLKSS
ncbi:MAG: gamma-D-glutamyl-L-lysine dipeptidyl-peptidase [Bacteroidales bacterium]|nr:gamma-D-glutamyl-L-lysine dipeptidyl-peptidase [Bacteroidales bacterium]